MAKSRAINFLSAARLFLFGARDVWFVIALPVFLSSELGWPHSYVGGFLACWIIVYGVVQSFAPKLVTAGNSASVEPGRSAFIWAIALSGVPLAIAFGLWAEWQTTPLLMVGLTIFGVIFAINSALHSFMIVHYASKQDIALDVGFYYMANSMGRLGGTVLSGAIFQAYGLSICLIFSSIFVLVAAALSLGIDNQRSASN